MLSAGNRLLSSVLFTRVAYSMANKADRTIYNFTVKDGDDKPVSLEKYRGKVVIVVNVASQCGLADSNYSELKELLDKYHDKGLVVAAFPCNQFRNQEPGCSIDIKKNVTEKYKFEPDLYGKIDVNGDNADPLYKFLKEEQGGTFFDAIKWNFAKFLVDREGRVVNRYAPTTSPKAMIPDIEKLL